MFAKLSLSLLFHDWSYEDMVCYDFAFLGAQNGY